MRRFFAVILCLALTGCNTAAPTPTAPVFERFLVQEAHTLTADMAALAADPSYRTLMTTSDEINGVTDALAAQSWAAPVKATLVTLPLELLPVLLSTAGVESSPPSPAVQRRLEQMLSSNYVGSMLAGQNGTSFLAAVSMLATSRGYVQPQSWQSPTVVLLEYGGDYAAIVSFAVSGEGVVQGSAMFATSESLSVLDQLGPLLQALDPPVELDSQSFTGQALEKLLGEA